MEYKPKTKKNVSVKFTEFMMNKEEAPFEMAISIKKRPN